MDQRLLAHHWVTPLALVPLAIMLFVHRWLDLSDAMMGPPDPGKTFWPLYNLAVAYVFGLGVTAYITHAFWMSDRGWLWVVAKCVALAVAWTAMDFAMKS